MPVMRRPRSLVLPIVVGTLVGLAMFCAAGAPSDARTARAWPGQRTQSPASAAAPADNVALVRLADEVMKEVEALRGWTFKLPVPKTFSTPAEVRQYLERQLQEQLPAAKMARAQAFLRTIGLIPPDCDLKATFLAVLENQVAGFYDSDTKSLHLVQRASRMPALVERTMLAHELTHALDDQYADLSAFVKSQPNRTEDMDIVMSSVVEGSATALMMQYVARAGFSGRFDMKELQQYAQQEMENAKPLLEAPRYFTAIVASYICGMQFLGRGNLMAIVLAPDNKAVGADFLAARKDPPRSSEQILHPEKYWNEATRDEPVLLSDPDVERILGQPGWFPVHVDTVGEMLTGVLTTPRDVKPDLASMQQASAWTTAAAQGWGGDRFYLLAPGANPSQAASASKGFRGVWITLWDTPQDREEFVRALPQGSAAPHAVAPLGSLGAAVFFGFDKTTADATAKRLEETPPAMTRGGRPWSPRGTQ